MTTQNLLFDIFILRNNPSRTVYYFFDHGDTYALTSLRFWPQVIFHKRLPNQYDAEHIGEAHGAWAGPTALTVLLALMIFIAYKFTRDEKNLWIKSQLTDEFLLAYYAMYLDDDGASYKAFDKGDSEELQEQHKMLRDLIDLHVEDTERKERLKAFATKFRGVITNTVKHDENQPAFDKNKYETKEKIRWYFDGLVNNIAIPFAYSHWFFWMISTVILYQVIEGYCDNPDNPERSNFSGAFSEDLLGNERLLWTQCMIGIVVAMAVWYYSKYKEDEEREKLLGKEGHTNFVKGRGLLALLAPFMYFTEDKFLEAKRAEEIEQSYKDKYDALRGLYQKNRTILDVKDGAQNDEISVVDPLIVETKCVKKALTKFQLQTEFENYTQHTRGLTAATNALGTFLLFNIVAWPIIVFATAGCDSDLDDASSQTITFFVTALFAGIYTKYKDDDLVKERERVRKAINEENFNPIDVMDKQKEKTPWDFWWKDKKNFHFGCYFVIGRLVGNGGFLLTRILFMGGGGNVLTGALIDQKFESRPLDRGMEDHHFDDNLLLIGFVVTAIMITLNMLQYRKRTELSEISAHLDDVTLEKKAPKLSI